MWAQAQAVTMEHDETLHVQMYHVLSTGTTITQLWHCQYIRVGRFETLELRPAPHVTQWLQRRWTPQGPTMDAAAWATAADMGAVIVQQPPETVHCFDGLRTRQFVLTDHTYWQGVVHKEAQLFPFVRPWQYIWGRVPVAKPLGYIVPEHVAELQCLPDGRLQALLSNAAGPLARFTLLINEGRLLDIRQVQVAKPDFEARTTATLAGADRQHMHITHTVGIRGKAQGGPEHWLVVSAAAAASKWASALRTTAGRLPPEQYGIVQVRIQDLLLQTGQSRETGQLLAGDRVVVGIPWLALGGLVVMLYGYRLWRRAPKVRVNAT